MEALYLKPTSDTPGITFDPATDHFEIIGRSFPEDSAEFFIPVLSWVDRYSKKTNPETKFIFKLEYFNSSSYKPFLDILLKLSQLRKNGQKVTILWCYKEDDWDMKEAGEEFEEIVNIPFNYATFK
ncbi:MAG: DUF1987 domain-containing protein [Bacteroidetes bacterium]|nr:DUF1987 domain-containing protein [Bacteroidota bacterium]